MPLRYADAAYATHDAAVAMMRCFDGRRQLRRCHASADADG